MTLVSRVRKGGEEASLRRRGRQAAGGASGGAVAAAARRGARNVRTMPVRGQTGSGGCGASSSSMGGVAEEPPDEVATREDVTAIRASDDLLAAAIRETAWRQRLRKRGHMFCRLYWEWMQEVCDSLDPATPPHFVPWHLLPGFKTMLICLLLEMRARSVVTYSEPLIQLSNQLLRCTHLHSLLVKIVFLKSSVHDVCAVSTTLNLLGTWMTSLAQRLLGDAQRSQAEREAAPVSQPLLRSTFDFAFFFKGMALIFASEHAQVLLKGIEFLYRHFDLMPEQQATEFRNQILLPGGPYWRLLLHWSPAVRKFFTHLLVFRLRKPVCWSLSVGFGGAAGATGDSVGAVAPPSFELPTGLADKFAKREARLREIAAAKGGGGGGEGLGEAVAGAEGKAAGKAAGEEAGEEGGARRNSKEGGGGYGNGRRHANGKGARVTRFADREIPTYDAALDVPSHLHVYAPAALALYDELDRTQRQFEAMRVNGGDHASISLPALRWDTSVLDIEEDRVIWVRESDLGQAVREGGSTWVSEGGQLRYNPGSSLGPVG